MLSDPFLPYNDAINRVATQNDHEEKIILTALRKKFISRDQNNCIL